MNTRSILHSMTRTRRERESGVALLTVLALLSIFAVVLAGFTYTIRMEENTIKQYADSVNVQGATEAAIQGVLAQLSRDMDPLKPNFVLGRPQPRYTSLLEPWAIGYAGWIGNNLSYDARSSELDVRPQTTYNRSNLRFWPTPIPRGVDEDPPGDVTGMKGIMVQSAGDGAAGLKNIDDDLDGEADKSPAYDDDEDYRVDEDGYDQRRDGLYFPPGTGYDQDGDRLGVFDENSKVNINFAGNNFGENNGQIYNLGVSTAELDLPVFLFNRITRYSNSTGAVNLFSAANAEALAKEIVSFRYGSVVDGGATTSARPGLEDKDDNDNGVPSIVKIQKYSNALSLSQFDYEPYAIVGDQIDNDNDGLLNEEDEHYIGPSTQNTSGTPLTEPFKQTNVENYRPGDKIDNDGNGYIDENREGVDDPGEFSVFKPVGDDRPYTTVEDLKLVGLMRGNDPSPKLYPTIYDILSDYATIYSQADEISGPLSGRNNEIGKINPNLTSNWLAEDIWNVNRPSANKADFQYSPKVRFEDLLALQVDNDGDWQAEAEVNLEDGKDNDGDGFVDEPSDDWDGNHYPSGDFDGFGEGDVGAPAFASGRDFDRDGQVIDKIDIGGDDIYQNLRKLGWKKKDGSGQSIGIDPLNAALVDYDSKLTDIFPGLVVEGNGEDNDGDLLIDDTGDFNGDSMLSYDPEWHVSEDAWGDMNGDGYPGLGANPESKKDSKEGRIYQDPDNPDPLLVTSLADDDYDGYADFYDPQVLAAMFAPEWDGVDNDNDGQVDEIGERYIACYDDDEDGRMDEDPPEFQIALNLLDYIDTWMPSPIANDKDIRQLLGVSQDDPILSDPVTIKTLNLYSTRERAFRMHPRLLTGPNTNAKDRQEFAEQMRLTLPNPPQIGYPVKFEGVESIRINEVMPKPVIRLEAEEVLSGIQYDETDPLKPVTTINYKSSLFQVSGNNDDGARSLGTGVKIYDSNWGKIGASADGQTAEAPLAGYSFFPKGFQNTFNPYLPIVNMDSLAPSFIFGVTNVAQPADSEDTKIGKNTNEEAIWLFENIPAGYYDVVLYIHPYHKYRSEVHYFFNGKEITMRSDYAEGDTIEGTGDFAKPWESELIRRDTAVLPGSGNQPFKLRYRLTPYPFADKETVTDDKQRVVVGTDGKLAVRIVATEPVGGKGSGDYYETSFDRIELISPWVQYVELVNLSTEDIDLSGWGVNTPFGHYIIPKGTVIGRMKPSFDGDDGRDLQINEGIPGNGVPYEPLLHKDKVNNAGTAISSTDLLLEDNKLLLANHKDALVQFIKNNYPTIPNVEKRVVEPLISSQESAVIQRSLSTQKNPLGSGELGNAQICDLRFRLVDVQDDVLSHNPVDKYVTLSDPAGQYVDSFIYRTTFNNLIVDIPASVDTYDLIALPGYRGMESFERTDPTYFETKMVVDKTSGDVSADRAVPSAIKLDAKDAIILNLDSTKDFQRTQIGGYLPPAQGTESDKNNQTLRLPRFADVNSFPAKDAHWNGWDFLGDYYEYPKDNSSLATLVAYEMKKVVAREAVAPAAPDKVQFYDLLGGFENASDVRTTQQIRYTAFVWRMGLHELIRAGYDPNVDDQLTVRVLGRTAINDQGQFGIVDLPVGEVLVIPTYRVINPGNESIDKQPSQVETNPSSIITEAIRSNQAKVPVFTKLRNGDTAFTIDLRDQYSSLTRDLKSENESEPQIEIAIIIRKSTPDQGMGTTGNLTAALRPDLALRPAFETIFKTNPLTPDVEGNYKIGQTYLGNLGDDNYYFRGIELFGRGRLKDDDGDASNAMRTLLAGTPGRDNSGYVPAYPRRRLKLDGKQRDKLDIVDNTAYVKNGPLATVGELSRLFTGNRFETVNTPQISQTIEDIAAAVSGRIYTSPDLGQRAMGNNPTYRKALAQRERLDQWENQYTQLYNMITTAEAGIREGLININTSTREVLMALPFCPPLQPGRLDRLQNRSDFNAICADFILSGRFPNGFDMGFGVHNLDDDDFLTKSGKLRTLADTIADFKLWSVGREVKMFKKLDDIESERFNPLNLTIQNVKEDRGGNLSTKIYLTTELAEPDDGPYKDIGTLLSQINHLRRRDRYSEMMVKKYDRTLDKKVDEAGDLREQINASKIGAANSMSPEDMEAIMNRISNLITVRSRSFSIVTQGRIFDSEKNITAQRKLEAVYQK